MRLLSREAVFNLGPGAHQTINIPVGATHVSVQGDSASAPGTQTAKWQALDVGGGHTGPLAYLTPGYEPSAEPVLLPALLEDGLTAPTRVYLTQLAGAQNLWVTWYQEAATYTEDALAALLNAIYTPATGVPSTQVDDCGGQVAVNAGANHDFAPHWQLGGTLTVLSDAPTATLTVNQYVGAVIISTMRLPTDVALAAPFRLAAGVTKINVAVAGVNANVTVLLCTAAL